MSNDSTQFAAPDNKKKPVPWKTIGTVASTISPVFFYLNGQAYHQGYLSFFGLESSMFQLDASATITASSVAWMQVLTRSINSIGNLVTDHPWISGLFFAFILLLTAFFMNLHDRQEAKIIGKTDGKPDHSNKNKPSIHRAFGKSAIYIFATGYGLFCITFLILISLVLAVSPFLELGKSVAAEDLKKGFITSLQVETNDTTQPSEKYRIIQCSATFCALYNKDEVTTVQVSNIKKGVFTPPKKPD